MTYCLCCICSGVVFFSKEVLLSLTYRQSKSNSDMHSWCKIIFSLSVHACILFSVCMTMYVIMYACMHNVYGWVWVRMCVSIYIHTYLYNIICFVHMGYFVMLWGGGGGGAL